MKKITIFDENLVGVHQAKNSIKLNKPIYIGMSVLDDAKQIMFDYYYNFLKKKIRPENLKLIFTDTDSVCVEIKNQDIYEIMKDNSSYFDLSNFLSDKEIKQAKIDDAMSQLKNAGNRKPSDDDIQNKLEENEKSGKRKRIEGMYDPTNKKVLKKMKEEKPISAIKSVCSLRAKVYSILDNSDTETKANKGVKRSVVKKFLRHEDYKACLQSGKDKYIVQNTFTTHKHTIYTTSQRKKCLSSSDDKVYILADGINTRSHGHYLNKIENTA